MQNQSLESSRGISRREEEIRLAEDPHLNLFYSYGAKDSRGIEKSTLIENNLTRAFVQTIRLLSDGRRHELLQALFVSDKELGGCRFERAGVALQDNIPTHCRPNGSRYKTMRIVTIATSAGDPGMGNGQSEDMDRYPDAWIFDRAEHQYCLLLECKTRVYPVSLDQIRGHAEQFGDDWAEPKLDWREMQDRPGLRLLALTWYDVLAALAKTFPKLTDDGGGAVELLAYEEELTLHLKEYIGYYGYRLFAGFRLHGWPSPILELPTRSQGDNHDR
jgi:hypothetical protein